MMEEDKHGSQTGGRPDYKGRTCRILSLIQIACAVLSIACNSVTLAVQEEGQRFLFTYSNDRQNTWGRYWWRPSKAHYVAVGFWAGLLFLFCGSIGLCAASWRTKKILLSHLVLSVLSSVAAAILLCVQIWAIVDDGRRLALGFGYQKYWADSFTPFKQHSSHEYDYRAERLATASLAFSVSCFIDGVVLLTTAIWCTTIDTRTLCRNDPGDDVQLNIPIQDTTVCVQYTNQSGFAIMDRFGPAVSGAQVIHLHLSNDGAGSHGRHSSADIKEHVTGRENVAKGGCTDLSTMSDSPPQYWP